MHRYCYFEETIANVAYPATIAAPIRRQLAMKLDEIEQSYNQQRDRLQNALTYEQNSRGRMWGPSIPLSELPEVDRILLANVWAAREALSDAMKALEEANLVDPISKTEARRYLTPDEVAARKTDIEGRLAALKVKRDDDMRAVKELAIEARDMALTALRLKLPAGFAARLDAIGKALPAATEAAAE